MLKFILPLIFLIVSSVATAETIYFNKPTSANVLAYLQSKGGENVSKIIWLVDPDTGDANRYYIKSHQDWDTANADLVTKVKYIGMSTDLQVFAKSQSENYKLVDTIANGMNGVEFDTYRLLLGNTGILDTLIESKFVNVRENLQRQSEGLPIHFRNVLSTEYQPIEFITKDGFKIRLKFETSGSGTFIVTLLSVKNLAGTPFYPRPDWDTTDVELINPTPAEFESLVNYFKTADYVVNFSSATSIPSGSVTIVDCHSATKTCDVSITPQNNKQ